MLAGAFSKNWAKNELKIHCLTALTSLAMIFRVGSLNSAKQAAVSWTKRSNDGNIRLSKHHGCVCASSQKEAVAFFPGLARFPCSHKQSRVRVMPRLFIVDLYSVYTPYTGMWTKSGNPCLETACRNQHWGKTKHFFSAVYLLKKQQVLQDNRVLGKGCWIRPSFFWPLYLRKCCFFYCDHYPQTVPHHIHTKASFHILYSHLASCSLSFSCPMYARHITKLPLTLWPSLHSSYLYCLTSQDGNQYTLAFPQNFSPQDLSPLTSFYIQSLWAFSEPIFFWSLATEAASSILLPQTDVNAKHPKKIHSGSWIVQPWWAPSQFFSFHKERQWNLATWKGVSQSSIRRFCCVSELSQTSHLSCPACS